MGRAKGRHKETAAIAADFPRTQPIVCLPPKRSAAAGIAPARAHRVSPAVQASRLALDFRFSYAARSWQATATVVTLGQRPWCLTPVFAIAPLRFVPFRFGRGPSTFSRCPRSASLHFTSLHSDDRKRRRQAVSPARQESWICFGYGSRVEGF
jgi:hypothetical protein